MKTPWMLAALSLGALVTGGGAPGADGTGSASRAATDPGGDFAVIARVLRHPRCLNCHTDTGFPRVGEERARHRMNVVRGPEDSGHPALPCSACHRVRNLDHAGLPGAPHWHLAPLSMGWEGLDDHGLAAALKDRAKNGDRSLQDLLRHVSEDPLVLWGWSPGVGRAPVPVPHDRFVSAFRDWIRDGAPSPEPGVTSH